MLKIITLLAFLWPAVSFSATQILSTRVILNQAEKEQTFLIRNTGEMPSLLQVWLSDKDNEGMNIADNIPLIITPPVARINPDKNKVFRLFPTAEAAAVLPGDRESMFWINALDAPAIDDKAETENRLNIAFRTRIKAFYRPHGLSGSLIEAGEKLKWKISKSENGVTCTVTNDSPYHISFAKLSLSDSNKEVAALPGDMVEPYASKKFLFKEAKPDAVTLNYQYITDLGAYIDRKVTM